MKKKVIISQKNCFVYYYEDIINFPSHNLENFIQMINWKKDSIKIFGKDIPEEDDLDEDNELDDEDMDDEHTEEK